MTVWKHQPNSGIGLLWEGKILQADQKDPRAYFYFGSNLVQGGDGGAAGLAQAALLPLLSAAPCRCLRQRFWTRRGFHLVSRLSRVQRIITASWTLWCEGGRADHTSYFGLLRGCWGLLCSFLLIFLLLLLPILLLLLRPSHLAVVSQIHLDC